MTKTHRLLRALVGAALAATLARWGPVACGSAPIVFSDDAALAAHLAPRILPDIVSAPIASAFSANGTRLLALSASADPNVDHWTLVDLAGAAPDRASAPFVPTPAASPPAASPPVARPVAATASRRHHEALVLSGNGAVALAYDDRHTLGVWSVRPDAAPSLVHGATIPGPPVLPTMALSHDGTLALVANEGDATVWQLTLQADGTFITRALGTFAASSSRIMAVAVAIRADGTALALTTASDEAPILWQFRIPPGAGPVQPDAPFAHPTPLGAAPSGEAPRVLLSPDGQLAAISAGSRGQLLRLDLAPNRATAPATPIAGDLGAFLVGAFDPTGQAFAAAQRDRVTVWDLGPSGLRVRGVIALVPRPQALALASTRLQLLTREEPARPPGPQSQLWLWDTRTWRPLHARLPDAVITWEPRATLAPWSRLTATRLMDAGTERLAVHNDGPDAATHVLATLAVITLDRTASPPATYTLHFGTIAPGQTVTRQLPLPSAERDVAITVTREAEPALPSLTWHTLMAHDHDAATLDAHAGRTFVAARDAMRELLGDPDFAPRLARLGVDAYGFVTSDTTVKYQNPYAMSALGLALNRQVLRVDARAELMAEMELMLDIYIPHEMTHAARHHLFGDITEPWREEYIANLVAPGLAARALALQPATPYPTDTVLRAYDRYVERLAPHVAPELRAMVERLIASDGQDHPPMSPGDLFRQDVATYVYLGARIAQYAIQTHLTLEQLRARFLVPPPPPKPTP